MKVAKKCSKFMMAFLVTSIISTNTSNIEVNDFLKNEIKLDVSIECNIESFSEKINISVPNIEYVEEVVEPEYTPVVEEYVAPAYIPQWQIDIPKIGLSAGIVEGITQDVLSYAVGHFPTTQLEYGNVGLAAHNYSFFRNINSLTYGDIIYYTYDGVTRTYAVSSIGKISEYSWERLDNTENNRLSLITCIEGDSSRRFFLQATEI